MASYEMPDGNEYEFSSDEEATRAMKAWSSQFGDSKSEAMRGLEAIEPSLPTGEPEDTRSIFGKVRDTIAAPIEVAGSVLGGMYPDTIRKAYAASAELAGKPVSETKGTVEEINKWIPQPRTPEGQALMHQVDEKLLGPLTAVMPNLQMMHALSSSGPLPNPLRKSVDPKLDKAKSDYEARVAAQETPDWKKGAPVDPETGLPYQDVLNPDDVLMRHPNDLQAPQYGLGGRVAMPEDSAGLDRPSFAPGERAVQSTYDLTEQEAGRQPPLEKPKLLNYQAGEPLVTFQDGTTMTRAEWERAGKPNSDGVIPEKKALTTEEEFYNLLKEEEQKLQGQDVDTSEVRNPYLLGDTKVNVEVDSVSGRPIFPEETKVDNTITKPDGSRRYGVHSGDDAFVTINPDSISRLWLELSPEKKAEMGLRNAEDLQNFVELHERKHMNDARENGGRQFKGETVADTEARTNRNTREDIAPLIADDSVGVARLPENFREPYDGAPREPLLRSETKSPAELRAHKELLERTLESVNKKLADLEIPGADHGTVNTAKLDAYKKQLEGQISKLQDTIEAGRKRGISFQPKSKVKPGQRGSVNFGFAEKVVDTAKKLLNRAPSFKEFAEHLGAKLDDPIAKELYNKYYGKEIKDVTPEQAAIAKIPGLKEIISPELQPLSVMMERWKVETDVSSKPLARALRENLSSGGRMTAMRTGSSFIDWNIENILGETRRAQVVIKTIQNEIKGEANKLTGTVFKQFRTKGESAKLFVEAIHSLLKSEGKLELPNIRPEAKKFADTLRKHLDDLGLKIQAELRLQGVENFQWRSDYLAGVFFGPYRSLVKDASGKVLGVVAGKTAKEASHAIEYVKQNMPDVTFDMVEYNPKFDTGPGSLGARYGKASEVLELLRNSEPMARQFQETLGDYYSKVQENYMGYTQHFKNKSGVFGSEGARPWADGLSNARDLLEAQLGIIDHGYHWLAEQKLARDINEILTNPEIGLRESKRYVTEYLDHAFGRTKNHIDAFDSALDFSARMLGISPSAFKEMTAVARNVALTGVLGMSGGFALSQFVQVPQALAVAVSKALGEGYRGTLEGAKLIGATDLVNGINGKFEDMSVEGRYFFKYFTKNGVLDPHLVEHTIHRKIVTTTGMNPIQKAIWESVNATFKTGELVSDFIGKYSIEKPEAWTRGTFAMTMAHYYKSAGMSLKEAVIKADKETSILFVDYSSQERAMAFQRLGELGKLASTVSTFKLNNLNQWFTFSNKKMYGTLASLALATWFTTGLYGMPFGDEVEFIATFFKGRGLIDKTPREWMLSDVPSKVAFGPLSSGLTVFGGPDMALHPKFSQANVISDDMPSFIYSLLSFYTNKVEKGADWTKSEFAKQEGAVLARELVPGNFKYVVDYLGLTNEKGLTIDPNQIHDKNPAHYDRTKNEWKASIALGVPSQREWKAKQMSQLDKVSQKAWKDSTVRKVQSTMSAWVDKDEKEFKRLFSEAVKYNPDAAQQIVERIQGNAVSSSVPFEKMLEMQFAKRATSQHGVKGLQQFQKMQRNN